MTIAEVQREMGSMVSEDSKEVLGTEDRNEAQQTVHGSSGSPEPEGSRKNWVRRSVVTLMIVATVGYAVWKIHANLVDQPAAATGKKSHSKSVTTPVTLAPVEQKKMPIYLSALGTVTPYNSVTVRSRVDGQLVSVNVREGQTVRKGQMLAQIDPAPYEALLMQAQGQLAKDAASAKYSKLAADRYDSLFKDGIISQDNQQLQTASAGQGAGTLIADQGMVQSAKVNLAYTRITSPIDGVVGLRQVDPGNMVHAADSTGLLLVTQLHPISVVFIVPEDRLPEVRKRMKKGELSVEVYDRSESSRLGVGKLLTLDNQIDQSTGTDKAKAVFPNADDALFPNQFVNVRLVFEQRPDAIVVPTTALQTGSEGTFVFVAQKGEPPASTGGESGGGHHHHHDAVTTETAAEPKATGSAKPEKGEGYYAVVRPVVVEVIEGNQAILKSGLAPGEQVVVDGQERLQEGSRIAPAKSRHKSEDGADDAKADGGEHKGGKGKHG
jgi:multidrug efflux system membrane fusion protein